MEDVSDWSMTVVVAAEEVAVEEEEHVQGQALDPVQGQEVVAGRGLVPDLGPAAVVVVAAVVSLVVLPSLVASHLGIRIGLGGQRIERGLETQDGEKANQGVDQGLEVIPSLLLDPVLDPGPGLGLQ